MKKNQILCLVLLFIGQTFNSFAQNDLNFKINKVFPFVSIEENKWTEINTLQDLNKHYPASWVKEYVSVDIFAFKNGTKIKASGMSDVLTQEQKELIQSADRNRNIAVQITYLPNNSLENNTAKQYDFDMTVMPLKTAIYVEGTEQLIQYLRKNGIENIEAGSFTGYDLTAIKFTITEQGDIGDIKVVLPSKDAKIDETIVAAISKMPKWKPAEFSNGLKVKQDFVLTIGNMNNCMVNLLNIRATE
jgi:hypothetical protein